MQFGKFYKSDHRRCVRYDKKAECLKRWYSNTHNRLARLGDKTVQLKVDGEFTFDENLCDIQALEMMSRRELANIEKEDKIPGVSFTKEQTFFINIAQVIQIFQAYHRIPSYDCTKYVCPSESVKCFSL